MKRKLLAYLNLIVAAYFLTLSFFYLISDITTLNVIFLIYSGLVFLVIGIGLLVNKLERTLYLVSYLTIVLLMSYLSIFILDSTNLDAYLVGFSASLLGVILLIVNEVIIKKISSSFSKKKLNLKNL